jgi:hypothetical protein
MQVTPKLSQPKTLVEGRRYLRRKEAKSGQGPAFHTVVFISYCACPAFIVVRDEEGRKCRCLREEVFNPETVVEDQRYLTLAMATAHPTGRVEGCGERSSLVEG